MNMLDAQITRVRALNPNLKLFLIGVALLGIAGGVFDTTFNNYLSDTFNISAAARGFLEFPRELPGFLTVFLAGGLFFLPETRIGAATALLVGLSMFGLAFTGNSWYAMLILMTLWSAGTHLMMPIRSSLGMELAHSKQKGRRLGQLNSVAIAAGIIGYIIVWITMKYLNANYSILFVIGGIAASVAAVFLYFMRMPNAHLQRPKFVWKKEYWLYYVLEFLFGARKQIFITFGPWVLIRIFQQQAFVFAQLGIVAAILGILFQPMLGKAIDHWGERTVLVLDSFCIFAVCAGYGFAHLLPNSTVALGVLYVCFISDQLLFGASIARNTYLSKIARRPEDISPTLSMGVSINHIVSMSVPAVGGLMWLKYGHSSVFIASAGVAVIMFIFSCMVRIPQHSEQPAN